MFGNIVLVVILATSVATTLAVGRIINLDPCEEVDKLIPDPKNCSRFYECTLDGWVGLFCYPGLKFNPSTLLCDYPDNVQCADESNTRMTKLEPCQKLDQLKPDSKNCSRFYECTLAGWVGEACNPGLEFNPATLQCDYPENVKCANETAGYDVKLEPCSELDKLIPDPKNCSRFYECTLNGWVGLFCYPGLKFNPTTLLCDYPENVQCANDSRTKMAQHRRGEELDYPKNFQRITKLEPCQQVDQLKPDSKNCSRFYECTLAGWVGEACNPGLEFNPATLQCDYPQNVKCANETAGYDVKLEPCSELDKLIPDPKNCSRFYECTLNGWVGLFCYPGLKFNPTTLLCDYPENVQCANESTTKMAQYRREDKLDYPRNSQRIKVQAPYCSMMNSFLIPQTVEDF